MKKRNDRSNSNCSSNMEPITITIHELDTLILLLSSKEEVVITALQNLDKKCSRDCKTLMNVFNLNILDKIMNIYIKSKVLFIQRISLKIVAELCQLTLALKQISCFVNDFLTIFCETNDQFMLEYSSNILQHIMIDPKICVLLQEDQEFIKRVVELTNSTRDVDVYRNALEMLIKITSDPVGLTIISEQNLIKLPSIFQTIGSEFPKIQKLSLKVFENFSSSTNEYFLKNEFLNGLLLHLEDSSFQELHFDLLLILSKLVRNKEIGKKIYKEEFLDRIFNLKQKSNGVLQVLVELSNFNGAREVLYDKEFSKMLLENLMEDISKECCDGIAVMSKFTPALMEFVDDSCLIQKLIGKYLMTRLD